MSIFTSTSRISHKWLERKKKAELASIIMANVDKIDVFADESRTRIAALEAALKPFADHYAKIPEQLKSTVGKHPRAMLTRPSGEKLELPLVSVNAFHAAEATLSGNTAALDRVVMEAKAEGRREAFKAIEGMLEKARASGAHLARIVALGEAVDLLEQLAAQAGHAETP